MSSILSPLSDFFFYILQFIHGWGISWSWSIVVLTIFVRIILVPLTWRQIKSMRALQALAPEIKALQEKYKDNKQLLNQKTMEFYQENKVSPFGSCLPLLLQMPVFFGLYYMLREQGQPGGAFAFPNPTVSWLWIADITKFDIILMFLYIASQFVASWQTSRKSVGQQKMIAYFMPIVVGIFMFIGKWPAGLFIYWFTSNLWTIAQQYVAERMMPMPAPAAGSAAKEKTSGRAPAKTGAKAGAASTRPKTTPTQPARKSGGKTSGQKTGAKGQATSSASQRSNRRTGGSKSSG
jgi:YidC/Oxa1 family membrane protein insertase